MIDRIIGSLLRKESIGPPRRGWRCPNETTHAAYVDARLSGSPKLQFERHLADCCYCLNQVAALVRLQAEDAPSDVPPELILKARALVERPGRRAPEPLLRWGAVAAAAASIVLVVVTTHRQPHSSTTVSPTQPLRPPAVLPAPSMPTPQPATPPTIRSQESPAPTLQLVYPREGSVLALRDLEFRWKPVPGALYYDIRVVTQEGDMIWEGRAEGTRAKLPSNTSLKAGEGFFVRVRAYLPEGKTITSRTVGFKVKSKS
jgi:hypothetical protein